MVVVMCNLWTPVIGKKDVMDDVRSVSLGLTLLVIYFCVTWSIAPLAYIRYPYLEIPNLYPTFQVRIGIAMTEECLTLNLQVLNFSMGIIVIIALGLASLRFRELITGRAEKRQMQNPFLMKIKKFKQNAEKLN